MASTGDLGGDPPCWAHLFEGASGTGPAGPPVVDLAAIDTAGPSGAVWSLPHGGDLDANLVRLGPGDGVGVHVNDEVDALLLVRSGQGELVVDGAVRELRPDVLALVPRGAPRSLRAGPAGLTYLSIHRRRGPLGVTRRRPLGEP
jgi:mannose-6-phosphate isomerase-like protein (cupin superfamily)